MKTELILYFVLFGLFFQKHLCHGTKTSNNISKNTFKEEDPISTKESYSKSSGKVALTTTEQDSHKLHSSESESDFKDSANQNYLKRSIIHRMIQSQGKNSFTELNTQLSHFSQYFNNEDFSSSRTLPTLFFMGLFGAIEFVIVSGVCILIFFPMIFNLLIMLHFMFKGSLIMLG